MRAELYHTTKKSNLAAEDYVKCLQLEPNNKTFIEKLKDSRKNLILNPSDLKNTEKPK